MRKSGEKTVMGAKDSQFAADVGQSSDSARDG
jgi:hypothetical protein